MTLPPDAAGLLKLLILLVAALVLGALVGISQARRIKR